MDALIEGVEPTISREFLLIKENMVQLTTLVVVLDTPGGKISLVTIARVGVVGTPDPNTCEVMSIES
jgi:hypothetical protein